MTYIEFRVDWLYAEELGNIILCLSNWAFLGHYLYNISFLEWLLFLHPYVLSDVSS